MTISNFSAFKSWPSCIRDNFSAGDINPSSAHLFNLSFASLAVFSALAALLAASCAAFCAASISVSTFLPLLNINIPLRNALSQ
nr:MAG: hypothetical protein [Bacteriophage sp.]UWG25713.1 MAG: hypothetical protein [Bacteriophage sp.]